MGEAVCVVLYLNICCSFLFQCIGGPPDSFNYQGMRALGITQLTLGLTLCTVGLVQTVLSEEDRAVALVSGAVVIWAPLFVCRLLASDYVMLTMCM